MKKKMCSEACFSAGTCKHQQPFEQQAEEAEICDLYMWCNYLSFYLRGLVTVIEECEIIDSILLFGSE